jgi:hypothetical protein
LINELHAYIDDDYIKVLWLFVYKIGKYCFFIWEI